MSIILLVAALSGVHVVQCKQVHYMADGRVFVSMVNANGVTAHAESHGAGSASGSVSVSSSSDGVSSASSSSSSDGKGRTVSVKRDANGCTVTINDRPTQE